MMFKCSRCRRKSDADYLSELILRYLAERNVPVGGECTIPVPRKCGHVAFSLRQSKYL